ncbi:MAG: LPS-assembly protein LptD, partial [Pedobacter sp.]
MLKLNPFDRKDRVGTQKFYQKLTVVYSLEAKNTVSDKESLVFAKGGLNRFQNGMQHTIPISLPFNVLQFLNFNSSVNYTEKWYFQSIEKRVIRLANSDSTAIDTLNGFKRAGEYNLNIGLSTKLYAKKEFKKPIGNISAIRHVITPNIGFSYKPDFSASNYGYYKNQVYYTNDIR